MAVYWKNHTKHPNTLCGQNSEVLVLNLEIYMCIHVVYVYILTTRLSRVNFLFLK
jgi:hypothetical protein